MERINYLQVIQENWEKPLVPEEARTPFTRFPRWFEEGLEACEAYDQLLEEDTPERRRELALEMADTLILGLSVISSLGYDAENLVFEKLERNHIKYDAEENRKLREDGLTWQEALAEQKKRWLEIPLYPTEG